MKLTLGPSTQASAGPESSAERALPCSYVASAWSAFSLADAIAADNALDSQLGRDFLTRADALGISAEGEREPAPRTKLRKVAEHAGPLEDIAAFAQPGAKLNIIRNCGGSLKSVAVGLRCWGLFCDALSRPHFPPTEEEVLAWSSFFATGKTFRIYVARHEKARLLLGINTSWKSKAVTLAGQGLVKAGGRTASPRPALARGQLVQLMTRRGWADSLAILILLSSTFHLRIPSEALPLTLQKAGEDLSSDLRIDARAVIGLVDRKLVAKLNRRKHMAHGSRLARVRICETYAREAAELHIPQLFCSACQLWPAITRLAHAGAFLFPNWTAKGVLLELRSLARARGWTQANRLGTRSCQRGAARAILEAGGSLSQLLRAGQWRSSAFRLHLDVGQEETNAASSLPMGASGGDD